MSGDKHYTNFTMFTLRLVEFTITAELADLIKKYQITYGLQKVL